MLNGLEKFGYGNWDQIAHHIGLKSAEETERHFHNIYPETKKHKGISKKHEQSRTQDTTEIKSRTSKRNDGQVRGLSSEDFRSLFQRKMLSSSEFIQRVSQSTAPVDRNSTVFGFSCSRNEFEVEHNNEAEIYLAELEFQSDDSPEETAVKESLLLLYMAKLEERQKRKEFVVKHGLLEFDESSLAEKQLSFEERLVRQLLKSQLQLFSRDEYLDLVNCVLNKYKFIKLKQQMDKVVKPERSSKQFSEKDTKSSSDQSRNVEKHNARRLGFSPTGRRDCHLGDSLLIIYYEELSFCNRLRIDFDVYLMMKECLVRKCCLMGVLSKQDMLKNSLFDKKVCSAVFDFLVERKVILKREE